MSSDRNIAINQPFVLIATIDTANDMLNDINEITGKKCILSNNKIYKLKIIPIIFIGCNIGDFFIDSIITFFLFVLSDLIYIPIVSYFF
jgi:hypothetical protein